MKNYYQLSGRNLRSIYVNKQIESLIISLSSALYNFPRPRFNSKYVYNHATNFTILCCITLQSLLYK